MRKALIYLFVLAMILTACTASSGSDEVSDSFCPKIERTEVDFSVLNDVRALLAQESVFVDAAQDSELLLNSTLETLFGYLGVRQSDIPQWARDIVNEEVERSNGRPPDFSVLNDVVDELLEDPRYSDLQDPSRMEELLETMIDGTINALGDPFTSYMRAEYWLTGFANNSGRFEGVGISTTENYRGEISIASVSSGSPAEKAGLSIGDAILKVNGLSVEDCTTQRFSLTVRGLEDPTLDLVIARELYGTTERETLNIEVTKEEIKQLDLSTYPAVPLPEGRGNTLEGVPYRCGVSGGVGEPCPFDDENGDPDILYIKIHRFSDQMRHDLEYALQELDEEYGLDSFSGVVVDVRDNPGGLVSATVDVVDFFLHTGDIIFTQREASGSVTHVRSNQYDYIPSEMPVVILMNDQSASGAEVFPAALRDNDRAVIVNSYERSRGKGTVNRHFTLRQGEYGAVYVSIAMWLTPTGEFVETRDTTGDGYDDAGGLKPDIYVPWSNEDYSRNNQDVNFDPTLNSALEWLQKQLE